jgi:hypothetical protein
MVQELEAPSDGVSADCVENPTLAEAIVADPRTTTSTFTTRRSRVVRCAVSCAELGIATGKSYRRRSGSFLG